VRRARLIVALAGGVLIALAGPAGAAAPGRWQAISGPLRGSDQDTALLRTADGRLHVAWAQAGATTAALLHRTIAPDGTSGPPSAVVSEFSGVSDPALLAEAGGLRILFGGMRTQVSDDPVQGIVTATSGDGGATWSAPQSITACCSPQGTNGGVASAVPLGDGTPLAFSSGSGFGIVAHRGLDPATPLVGYADALAGYGTTMGAAAARDLRSGVTVVAFQATAGPRDGIYAQIVDEASGGPQGTPAAFPGLGAGFVTSGQLTRIAARAGGGLFVAFPDGSGERTLLWRVGSPRARELGRGGGTHHVASVTATPDVRVWVLWTEESAGKVVVVARRSNPAVTRFGQRVRIAAPTDAQRIHAIDASSQALRLDVVATVGTYSARGAGYSHQHAQLLPPLELSARPRSLRGGSGRRVRFTVTDVGVPVAGVTVRAAGRSATTDARGRAVLRLKGPRGGGRIRVSAHKTDYRDDHMALTVGRGR
jgi:hypothetical protein